MNQKFDLRSQEWPILYRKCKLVGAVWRDLVSKNGTENKFTYYRGSVRDTYSPPWSLPGFELSLPNCWLLVNKRHLFATTKNTNLQRLVMKNVFRRRHHITSPAAITQMMASWDRHHVISWRVHLREFAQYGERWALGAIYQPKFRPVRPGKVVHVKRWKTSKPFRLDRTDPLSFGPKFPEILVEWIAPSVFRSVASFVCGKMLENITWDQALLFFFCFFGSRL